MKIDPDTGFKRPLQVNNWKLRFDAKVNPKKLKKALQNIKKITIPMLNGKLTVEGNFSIYFQDERFWGHNYWSLRFMLNPSKGIITQSQLKLKLTYTPVKSILLDLRPAMNLPFADNIAGDGKGGWTDQGSINDMKNLPLGKLKCHGIEFDIIDPIANNSAGCIGLFNPRQKNLPHSVNVKFSKPQKGKYLYLLHALAWPQKNDKIVGEISCALDSSVAVEKQTMVFPVISGKDVADFWMPKTLENAVVAWKGNNLSAPVGLYMTRFELTGEPLKNLTITTRGLSNWMILSAALSEHRVSPHRSESVTIKPGKEYMELEEVKPIKKGSILDFSFIADAPAGKYGYLQANGENFEFSKRPGVTVRFYGNNILYWAHYLSKKAADKLADSLAASGYNIVRFHMFDIPQSIDYSDGELKLKPDYQDKIDYLVYALKKCGIYVTLDVFGIRRILKGELPEYPNKEFTHRDVKPLIFAYPEAMRDYKSFARNLFNHVNPYTKLAWKDEPTIAMVSFINEGTLFSSAVQNKFISGIYNKKFQQYVKNNKLLITPQNRSLQFRKFLAKTYLKGFTELYNLYKNELKLKALLTDQNYSTSLSLTVLRNKYDYVDNHFYWSHPVYSSGKNNSVPMVVMNSSSIPALAGGVSSMFPSRIFGKPFVVSEWNHCTPNSFWSEGPVLTGAYGALQNWGMLCRFAYLASERDLYRKTLEYDFAFRTFREPLVMLSERIGTLLFVRGDVKASKDCFPFLVDKEHINVLNKLDNYPSQIKYLGLLAKVGSVIAVRNDKPKLPPNTIATLAYDKNWQVPVVKCLTTPYETLQKLISSGKLGTAKFDPKKEYFQSSTGELILDRTQETFQVITPRNECFVGPAERSFNGKFAMVTIKKTFGTVMIAAMDREPLKHSKRMLILHLTDEKNSGMRFSSPDMNTTEHFGNKKLCIRRGKVKMTINKDLNGYKLYAVGFDGKRLTEISISIKNGKSSFILKTDSANEPVPAYELIDSVKSKI